MICLFLIHTVLGKILLSKSYIPMTYQEKRKVEKEIHALTALRTRKQPNFIVYNDYTIVTRRYSNLHFSMLVTKGDNEMANLEIIHFFVETLDLYFGTVYERNIIDDFQKVQAILDEIILAGEVQETGKEVIISQVKSIESYM